MRGEKRKKTIQTKTAEANRPGVSFLPTHRRKWANRWAERNLLIQPRFFSSFSSSFSRPLISVSFAAFSSSFSLSFSGAFTGRSFIKRRRRGSKGRRRLSCQRRRGGDGKKKEGRSYLYRVFFLHLFLEKNPCLEREILVLPRNNLGKVELYFWQTTLQFPKGQSKYISVLVLPIYYAVHETFLNPNLVSHVFQSLSWCSYSKS